jgi:hypothetical protein
MEYCGESFIILSGRLCYNICNRLSWDGLPRPLKGGGWMISMFEAMYLMIAFATLVVMIMKKK